MTEQAPIPEHCIWHRGDDWLLMYPVAPGWERAVGIYSARRRKSLDRIVGDHDMREKILGQPIRPDRICAVIHEGEVKGCLSYRMDGKGAVWPQIETYWREFGAVQGTLRYLMTQATLIRGRAQDLYVEGYAVAPELRGKGIGKALLNWLSAEVTRNGKEGWRTEMPDGSEEAARAYTRFGAKLQRRIPLGPVGWLLGYPRVSLLRWVPPEE